ncbi:MAG TPA: hypothetical protein VFZ44_15685 [Pyrinomonadaceae bacterium]
MKSIILCVCVAASLAGVSSAQVGAGKAPRPNLTGTWALDKSRSNYGEARGRDISKADSTLVIEHRDSLLSIEKTVVLKGQRETKQYAFYTDGRGESNPMAYGGGRYETRTKWNGRKVVAHAGNGNGSESTQTWELSADGQTLTTVSGSQEFNYGGGNDFSPWHSVRIKLVYRRAP